MTTLSIIGCGAVGKTVGRLFHDATLFHIKDVLARSFASAASSVEFLGAGRPVAEWRELQPADVYLIAASDDAIALCATQLAANNLVRPGTVVWHLSGALPSSVLQPVAGQGALVASVHPVKSFADFRVSIRDFAGTWCGIEGDPTAVALLSQAFGAIGARLFPIDPGFKTVYHSGAVLVCNYLTALLETGLRAYEKGGVPRDTALQVIEPLVRGTVDNVFRVGTAQALTGPIARGDASVVAAQLDALHGWDREVARIYRSLAPIALDLSRERGQASEERLAALEKLLGERQWQEVNGSSGAERRSEAAVQAEEALLVNQKQLRALATELSLVEERERRRIASELHDEIGQNLALAKIKLQDKLCGGHAGKLPSGCARSVQEIGELLERAIQEVRTLTFQISPPLLYEVGLEAAVEWLCEQFQEKHGLSITLSCDEPAPIEEDLGSTLYHAVRELLVNVVKHARASEVTISLRRTEGGIRLMVKDDGKGLPEERDPRLCPTLGGFGLFNIRQRVQHFGGWFEMESRPGAGTTVAIAVPVAAGEQG